MNLFEAIVEANHRAVAGDTSAGLHPAEFAASLPVVALTCIDVRLNALLPAILGLPADQFIWLRNAGNIITSSSSSTMRSLALACAVKGGREIAILGHTDCKVRDMTILELTNRFGALGIPRHRLPDDLTSFFGVFASEQQNVIRSVEFARQSPLTGPRIPVHGLLVDIRTGRLDWVVNGYQALATVRADAPGSVGVPPSRDPAFDRQIGHDSGPISGSPIPEPKSPSTAPAPRPARPNPTPAEMPPIPPQPPRLSPFRSR